MAGKASFKQKILIALLLIIITFHLNFYWTPDGTFLCNLKPSVGNDL